MCKSNKLLNAIFLALIPFTNVYACSYTNNGDGTLTDSATNLVWQQNKAASQVNSADWYQAMELARNDRFLEKTDWRLPTNNELTRFMASGCWNRKNGYYHSVNTRGSMGFIAYMEDRRLSDAHPMKGSGASAVLVRGGSTADQAEFNSQFETKFVPYLKQKEQAAQDGVRRQVELADRNRKAALAEAQAAKERELAEAKFQETMNSNSPQKMYISAGTYDRSGESNWATQLYEKIISRFPDSNWAVKASDQLSAKQRDGIARDSINSANSNASRRAYQQCKIEMDSCYQSTSGKGNCWRDCDKLLL